MTRAGEKLYSHDAWRSIGVPDRPIHFWRWIVAATLVGMVIGSALSG